MGFKFSKISKKIKSSSEAASKKAIKPIIAPIQKILSMVKGLGKMFGRMLKPIIGLLKGIFKMISKVFKQLVKIVKKVVKVFVDIFKKLFAALKKAFQLIFFYIKCTIQKIQNTPRCMLYYLVDILFFTLLIPVRIIIAIFPALEELEDMFKDTIDMLDGIIYNTSKAMTGKGIHINRWPNGVLNTCYRCKAKTEDDGDADLMRLFKELTEMTNGEPTFYSFFLKAATITMTIGIIAFYIYKYFMLKQCTPMGGPNSLFPSIPMLSS